MIILNKNKKDIPLFIKRGIYKFSWFTFPIHFIQRKSCNFKK